MEKAGRQAGRQVQSVTIGAGLEMAVELGNFPRSFVALSQGAHMLNIWESTALYTSLLRIIPGKSPG